MGGEESLKSKIKRVFKKTNKISENVHCPFCNASLPSDDPSIFNNHTRMCGIAKIKIKKACDLYPPSQDIQLNALIFKNQQKYNNTIKLVDKGKKNFDDKIKDLKSFISAKKNKTLTYTLSINRENLLNEVADKVDTILNLNQDWKIDFIGEISYDVGGILREFFSNIFKVLEGESLKLFVKSETKEFSYIINPFLMHNKENFRYMRLVGILIAKALMQNVTINICLNKLIYKMILEEKIEFDDLAFIDTEFYTSIKNLKENIFMTQDDSIVKELGFIYSLEMNDCYKHIHSLDLMEKGRNISVENLDDYVQKRIDLLVGLYYPFIQKIQEGLFMLLSKDKISAFTSNELELIINGRPFIDLEEWENFTLYKGAYNKDHIVIKWFWEILAEFTQKELSNLLLFATGASRVPLGGFEVLESNGGTIYQFTIEYINYDKFHKNFIKAHTCFNRIDLPCYPTKQELEEALRFVSEREMWGFGIE
jgi:hypothetical protein